MPLDPIALAILALLGKTTVTTSMRDTVATRITAVEKFTGSEVLPVVDLSPSESDDVTRLDHYSHRSHSSHSSHRSHFSRSAF
jgi:hypothetical protein